MLLGVDTGGTFTDFVCFDERGMRLHKVLSTPDDPSRAILQGIKELKLEPEHLHLVHGSTVATNAILERKGVRTLFVTHQGMEGLITIGRQTRRSLYDLSPVAEEPWLEQDDCFGVQARLDAEGSVIEEVNSDTLQALGEKAKDYDAVALCLLFSFLNNEHEMAISKVLPDHCFISLSHQVLAEYREYERASTTFLNAYVGPLVQSYLTRLERELAAKQLFIMHSAGGVMPAAEAGKNAVRLVLSGPAGGLVAARHIGDQLSIKKLLSFDMGGTSTDVALLDGRAAITTDGKISGMPVAVPMLDIHTIGAGGGSIAWLDVAGLPQVGPQSAGAKPGPACYGKNGSQPTVTDANVVLGRVPASARLAGSMSLDVDAARLSMLTIAESLGLTIEEAAEGVIRIAEEHMAAALRVVSVQRGYNPKDFSLLCFGGAGGLHACSLAEQLGIRRIIFPVASGAFSALGMLVGKRQNELSRSRRLSLNGHGTVQELQRVIEQLKQDAVATMPGLQLSFEVRLDLCYEGQGFHLSLPYQESSKLLQQHFEEEHELAYGYRLSRSVEVMTIRVTASADAPAIEWQAVDVAERKAAPYATSNIYHVGEVAHYRRGDLSPEHTISGPALVLEETSTLWLPANWQLSVTDYGHLILEQEQ